jgi:hypothetical protein
MILVIIIAPFVLAALIAGYGFKALCALAPSERPSWGWSAALVLLLLADSVLVLAFLVAIAVYNCHGRYECPV